MRDLHREAVMADLYRSGRTLQQIGLEFGVSRERVRQILRRAGVSKHIRPPTVRPDKARLPRPYEDVRALCVYGCSMDEAIALNDGQRLSAHGCLALAYRGQRRNACARGIEWAMTFAEWLAVWRESGRLAERGLRGDGFVMGRINDSGPYKADNVSIIRQSQNARDYHDAVRRQQGNTHNGG